MASIRISIAVAFALGIAGLSTPASSAETRKLDCPNTLAQYSEALTQLRTLADQARAKADQNPIYESDVKYYASILIDAYECAKITAPVATAFR